MSGPWTKYQKNESETGPWSKFGGGTTEAPKVDMTAANQAMNIAAMRRIPAMQWTGLLPEKAQSRLASGMQGIMQGGTLGFGDEIVGGLSALSPNQTYKEAVTRQRALQDAAKETNPLTYLGGELAGGGVTGGAGVARTGLGRMAGAAAFGGAYGAGTGEGGVVDRLDDAALGATIGAGAQYGLDKVTRAIAPKLQRKIQEAVPSLDELKSKARGLYKEADRIDVELPTEKLSELAGGVSDALMNPQVGFDKVLNRGSNKLLKDLRAAATSPQSTAQLNSLQKRASRIERSGGEDGYTAGIIKDNIDEFLRSNVPEIAVKRRQADGVYRRYKGAETIEKALDKANRMTAKSGTGGNLDNNIRTYIEQIRGNDKKVAFFNDQEVALMDKVIKGTDAGNRLRALGRFSPETGGLTSLLSVGGAASPAAPITIPLNALGFFSKRAAEKQTQRNIDELIKLVRTGSPQSRLDTKLSKAIEDERVKDLLAKLSVVSTQ